ncbi:MAG: asparagine synthase (glutamine-hydrolyzing) [Patescibacteria group bacterium]|nr:asparagine synthase (glutamine-hydrolyzing) [Patescibacteria group bacterium]
MITKAILETIVTLYDANAKITIIMCGILALISQTDRPDKEKFSGALEKQKYRGPDGSRIVEVTPSALFGFNRLTIQDLTDKSMQPYSHDGNWLIFNGEIYNFKEMRDDLISEGASFGTTGDTEVLAVGLSMHGPDFIKRLNGIFAICFYNKKKDTYLVARDIMGIKPLFYHSNSNQLIFSSDVNSILEYVTPKANEDILKSQAFLDWFVGPDQSQTYFKDIHSLSRGTIREYSAKGEMINEQFYGALDFDTSITDYKEAEPYFKQLLEKTFELETRSDAKVGILLSGGIDSSTVITYATPHLIKTQGRIPVYTFYYGTNGERDDLSYSEKVIANLQSKYGDIFDVHNFDMGQQLTSKDFEESVRARGMPVSDIRQIVLLKFYKKIHEDGIKVVLNGQGSDEIYYGYYPLDYWMSKFYRFGKFDAENVIDYYGDELNARKLNLYQKSFVNEAKQSAGYRLSKSISSIPSSIKEKEKRITCFFIESILQTLLLYEDKGGMFSSIEVRVPLINRLLVEYANKCDFNIHIRSSDSGRHLFRASLKEILDDGVIARPKNPTPKKKHYTDELMKIYSENKEKIISSPLLKSVYKQEFLDGPLKENGTDKMYAFYGNPDDSIIEMLGLFFFEKVYLV